MPRPWASKDLNLKEVAAHQEAVVEASVADAVVIAEVAVALAAALAADVAALVAVEEAVASVGEEEASGVDVAHQEAAEDTDSELSTN